MSFFKTRWLAAILLLFMPATVIAQGDDLVLPIGQSTWWNYKDLKEEFSIVRSDNNYRVVHTQYKEPATGMTLHTFIILNFNSGIETYFTTYFNAVDNTQHYVYISDMELFEGECYFCGWFQEPYYHFNSNNLFTEGFVGHFSPQAMQNASGNLLYYKVPQTTYLTHLAISGPHDAIALVNAVGTLDDYSSACLVELKHTNVPDWRATLDVIPSIPDISFSDILTTYDSIILLSQFKCRNNFYEGHPEYDPNHQLFLLDRFSLAGCHDDCSAAYIHYMAHYFLSNEDFVFHEKDAPMLLCKNYETYNGCRVAFGVRKNDDPVYGMRIFEFPTIWRYNRSIRYKTGLHPRIVDIGCMYHSNAPVLLSEDNSLFNRYVTILSPNGNSGTIPRLTGTGRTFSSVTQKRNYHYIDVTGHDSSYDYKLHGQDVDSLHLPSCFNIDNIPFFVHPERSAALLVADWEFKYEDEPVNWLTAEIIDQGNTSCWKECWKY